MKRGTPEHPKTIDLAQRLGVPRYVAVGILESLWHFTSEFAPQGNIGKYTDAAIAGHIGWEKTCKELITFLIEAKWVDKCAKHRLIVHDWHEHADQTVKRFLEKRGLTFVQPERVTRPRQTSMKLANASSEKAETPPRAGLPLPLPIPIPIPPRASSQLAARDEGGASMLIGETAQRMYALHPKKKNVALVPGSLSDAVKGAADLEGRLREIEECHAAWCACPDWNKDGGRFAPQLAEWISDQGYTRWPPGHSRNRPAEKPLKLYVPPKPMESADDRSPASQPRN